MTGLPPTNFTTGRTVQFRATGILARLLTIACLIVFIILAILFIIPILIILLVLGFFLFVYFRIKMLFTKAHDPGGPLDGRRNVKVIDRDE